jgi:mono/diheme cytochrome c family protein
VHEPVYDFRVLFAHQAPGFGKAVAMRAGSIRRVVSGALLALSLGLAIAGSARAAKVDAVVPHDPGPSDPVGHGAYLVHASDCMPCHTGPGQPAFSGGLPLNTPFGLMVSPNITPDKQTGIGLWTDDQFYRIIHDGIGRRGEYIYPVMSFTSYTKVTRQDVMAIKAYLFSLKPVRAERDVNQLAFPFNIRLSLLSWRIMFFQAGTYRNDPTRSAVWNRGAYLVQGAGHCGECHTPRNLLGAMELGRTLSGGIVDNYYAPNISADPHAGLGARTVDEVKQFLRTGEEQTLGVAFGPMAEVVHYSMRWMTDADLTAIATYLLNAEKRPETVASIPITPPQVAAGQAPYAANCAQCHRPDGSGVPHAIPNLAGNAAVVATQPDSVIAPMLNGLPGGGTYGAMPSFAGALTNQEIADIANYARTAWGNSGSANATADRVAGLRAIVGPAVTGAAGTNAARAFNCPKVGSSIVGGTMATPEEADLLAGGTDGDMLNRMTSVIHQLRTDNPDAGPTEIGNAMYAAYCPAVANSPSLSASQKAARIVQFNLRVGQIVAMTTPPPGGGTAMITATVSSAQAEAIAQAAQTAGMTPAQWLAKQAASASAP